MRNNSEPRAHLAEESIHHHKAISSNYIEGTQKERMNVIQAIQFYINNMVSNIQGMKVFLLDKETVFIFTLPLY